MKVFRKWKLLASLKDPATLLSVDSMDWPNACDGVQADILRYLGFGIKDEWCEEVDDEI